MGIDCPYLADVFESHRATLEVGEASPIEVVGLRMVRFDYRHHVKRVIDFALASSAVLLLAPAFVAVALAVKLTSPGPILYSQVRHGLHRRPFRMYKFRTMVADAERLHESLEARNEASGPIFKIREDPRVTRVGRFLRKTSLDELPQLVHVVLGQMSLVGPRPLAARDVQRIRQGRPLRRFSVRPGLTCLWQISGRSELSFDEWMELDFEYIDHWSLWLDLKILARTPAAVISGRGAV
jgi:lipopolysaccharide/colanic/teichoic acid biosynthesis glycosyltransferase